MAAATLNDVIKVLNQNARDQGYDAMEDKRTQENILKEIGGLNTALQKFFLADKSQRGDELEEKREKRQKASDEQKAKSGPTTFKGGLKSGLGLDFLQNIAGYGMGLLSSGFGALGGAALAPAFGKILGKTLTRGALFSVMSLWGSDLIRQGFRNLTGKEMSFETADMFTNILNTTLLGSIFGRKGAFAGLIYGIVDQGLKKTFPNKDDDESNWQKKVNLLGIELPFTNEDFTVWGTTIASFFAPSLITGAIRRGIGLGGRGSTEGKKSFLKGFKPSLNVARGGMKFVGWAGVLGLAGYTLANAIGDISTGEIDAETLLNLGVGATSILGMFGSGGMLMTGIVGLAIGGGYLLYNYLQKRQAALDAEFQEAVEKRQAEIEGSLASGDMSEMDALASLKLNATVAGSRQRISAAERKKAKIEEEALKAAAAAQGIDLEAQRAAQIANASTGVFFQKFKSKYNIYDASGKKLRTSGSLPEGLMPLSMLNQDMGERLFSFDTGQTQGTGFLDDLKLRSYTGNESNLANIIRNNNRTLDRYIQANDLMPPMANSGGGMNTTIVQGGTDNSSSTAVLENGSIVVQDVGLDGQSN